MSTIRDTVPGISRVDVSTAAIYVMGRILAIFPLERDLRHLVVFKCRTKQILWCLAIFGSLHHGAQHSVLIVLTTCRRDCSGPDITALEPPLLYAMPYVRK